LIFDYPDYASERRHGPEGYTAYESFRPWLRDEFTFRCVYCLKRESWGQVTGEFELDHFEPQSITPDRKFDYQNLVYACRRCNAAKFEQRIDDPWDLLFKGSVKVITCGEIVGMSIESRRLILQLDLNSPSLRRWRVMWMRIFELARERDPWLYRQLAGFPANLPDLSRLRPPKNHRPEGIESSWFAKRYRGELPAGY